MTERVEVKTKAAAEKAINIVAGTFALSLVNVNISIWVSGDAAPMVETWETSAPRINDSDNPVPLIFLSGFRWRITISATRMAIGCQEHNLTSWWAFDDHMIERMDSHALGFWRANKANLQAICAATGRISDAAEQSA